MKLILQSSLLLFTLGLIFIWEETGLSDYTIPMIVFLALGFGLGYFIYIKRSYNNSILQSIGIMILTFILFLIIGITGNLYSPVFYLIYFLGFGLAFIFEPNIVFVFAIGAVLITLPEALKNDSLESYIKLGSILAVSPLSYFFGREMKNKKS